MTIHQGKESFFIISIYYLTTIIIVVVARVLSPFLLNSNKGTKRVSFFFLSFFRFASPCVRRSNCST